jgi:hypothetical protein
MSLKIEPFRLNHWKVYHYFGVNGEEEFFSRIIRLVLVEDIGFGMVAEPEPEPQEP